MRGASDRSAQGNGAESETPVTSGEGNRSNCWILAVVDHRLTQDRKVSAIDVLKERLKQNIWLVNSKNVNVRHLSEGDEVVFYLGNRAGEKGFVGVGILASEPRPLTASETSKYGSPSSQFDKAVSLRDTKIWLQVKPAAALIPRLSFIKNKQRWGVYFEGGIINLPKPDFELIISA
ncbi:MAG: EVE domain-containing protein [Thaumarchaeota archaeon]|nr:EVE domain-containing protein [Nitrososphaerota archaeon]MCL5317615.1 EVE domain-containing protein [Nitrososphaerota archaeon]